jgi:hypothetical protein
MTRTKPGATLDFSQCQLPELPKKIHVKRLPKAKVEEAKKAVARLKEKYQSGISARPLQGPSDAAYEEFVSKLDEDDLESGLEGTAELGDLDSPHKP